MYYRITLPDKFKTIDDKIKANPGHYDLGREAAEIKTWIKNKNLTGENLAPKLKSTELAKFWYSPFGKIR